MSDLISAFMWLCAGGLIGLGVLIVGFRVMIAARGEHNR